MICCSQQETLSHTFCLMYSSVIFFPLIIMEVSLDKVKRINLTSHFSQSLWMQCLLNYQFSTCQQGYKDNEKNWLNVRDQSRISLIFFLSKDLFLIVTTVSERYWVRLNVKMSINVSPRSFCHLVLCKTKTYSVCYQKETRKYSS